MTLEAFLGIVIPASVNYFLSYIFMLTNLKKLMALSSAVAIVAMNLVPAGVGAAGVNDGVASDNGAGGIAITGTITGTSATVRVEKDGVATTATTGTIAAGVLTIADVDGVVDSTVADGYYVITFNTDTNDFGSATFTKGLVTGNQVNVTATVVPTLSLTLANANVTFGVLTPGTAKDGSVSPVLTVKTNATLGYTLQVASASGALASGSDRIESANADLATADDGYGMQATLSGGTVQSGYGVTGATVAVLNVAATDLMKGSRTNGDVATLSLKAKASNTTAAGNYSDTLTFTLAGTF